MEQLDSNLLFRGFVGLAMDAPIWDPTVFTKTRDRFLERATLGADKAYAVANFVADLRALNVTPQVAQNTAGRGSAIDGRTTRQPGYAASQRARKRIEEAFGWIKTVGGLRKTRQRGIERIGWMFTLSAAACNLLRLPKLLGAA
jgi:hypothetical protein